MALHTDVSSLWQFYYGTHLGAVTQRHLQRTMRSIWPDVHGCNVIGYGFAAPFLRSFRTESTRTLCLMPEAQGAKAWPREGLSATTLVEPDAWPLPTGFVDRLIIAHGIEGEQRLDGLMEEIWRVLAPEGRVMIVAANRSGLWARGDTTPFGTGRPWSYGQLERLLDTHNLTPLTRSGALYIPPSERRFWLRSAGWAEKLGRKLDAQRIAGALIVEASKRVYSLPRNGSAETSRGLLKPIKGLSPQPKPVGASNRD